MRWFVSVHDFASVNCRFTRLKHLMAQAFLTAFPFQPCPNRFFFCQWLKLKSLIQEWYDWVQNIRNCKKANEIQFTFWFERKKLRKNFAPITKSFKHTHSYLDKLGQAQKNENQQCEFFFFTLWMTKSALDNLIYTNGVSFLSSLFVCFSALSFSEFGQIFCHIHFG